MNHLPAKLHQQFINLCFIIFVSVSINQVLYSQIPKGIDWVTAGLKGKVRTVTSGIISDKNKQRALSFQRNFNRQGSIIQDILFSNNPVNQKNSPIMKSKITMQNSLLTRRTYDVLPTDALMPMVSSINGKPPQLPPPPQQEADGSRLHQAVIKRDKEKKIVEIVSYKHRVNDSPIRSRIIYLYDTDGKIFEEQFYTPESNQPEREQFKYNSDGIEIEATLYKQDGTIHSSRTFSNIKSDALGNWILRTVQRDKQEFVEFREITYYSSAK